MILTALSVKSESSDVQTRLLGRHNDWFVPGLYKNELRRTWSMGLLFAIVLFFAIPVVNLMVFSNRAAAFTEYPDRVLSYLNDFFTVSNPFIVIFACLGGMMCAMVVAEYLFDRRKTNFVCSLPVKRQAYLLTKAAANLTWCVLAWIPATVLMFLAALLTETMRPHLGLVMGGCFVMLAAWLCIHLYFFGLTLLSCCFCGTGVMGGCMLLFVGGYIPVTVLSLLGLAEMTFDSIDVDYYLSADFFSAISGVFRVFYHTATDKSVWFLLGCTALGLLFTAGAVWLTVIRQSEKAGTPFAFDRVRDLVKYLLMGLAALLGGMLFEAMSSGYFTIVWMLFGCICGAVLCWMLCNTVFYKTPKMMFTGRRGMVILTACMMVFSMLVRFDVLGMERYVPSNVMTRKIELQHSAMPINVEDKSLVRIFNAMAKNGEIAYTQYGMGISYKSPTDYKLYEGSSRTDTPAMINIGTAVWKTGYLVPIARHTNVLYSDWAQFVEALTAREDFADLYFARALDQLDALENKYPDETYYVSIDTNGSLYQNEGGRASGHLKAAELRAILEAYREAMRAMGADALQQIYTGALYIRLYDNRSYDYYNFPLFLAYDDVVRLTVSYLNGDHGYVDRANYEYDNTFISAKVYHNGVVIDQLTEHEFEALMNSGVLGGNCNTYDSPMTLIDPDYAVQVTYHIRETCVEYSIYETEDYTYINENGAAEIVTSAKEPVSDQYKSYNDYQTTEDLAFFWGKVPAEYLQ